MKEFLVNRLAELKAAREESVMAFNNLNGRIMEIEQLLNVFYKDKVEEVAAVEGDIVEVSAEENEAIATDAIQE